MDEDGSGDIDFSEFVLCIWNYCTLDLKSLIKFAFGLFDADGSGTMEYNEFLLGLKGPLFSALERIRMVLEENRIYRDMRSFKGKNLDPSE